MNKFKAWHTGLKKMFYSDEISMDQLTLMPDGSGFWNIDSTSTKLSQHVKHMIPLEYIGEKDCNHKEICEGDILKWDNPYASKFWVVERTHCGWNPFIDNCQTDGTWHYEIVGNIYENPELSNDQ
jgi:hypothetical protein